MAFQPRRFRVVLAAAALPLFLAACNSTPETAASAPGTPGTVDRSAVYPEITGARTAATAQMSDQEAAGYSARLTALSNSRRAGTISEAEYRRRLAELQALAADHGSDTLSQIAGEN